MMHLWRQKACVCATFLGFFDICKRSSSLHFRKIKNKNFRIEFGICSFWLFFGGSSLQRNMMSTILSLLSLSLWQIQQGAGSRGRAYTLQYNLLLCSFCHVLEICCCLNKEHLRMLLWLLWLQVTSFLIWLVLPFSAALVKIKDGVGSIVPNHHQLILLRGPKKINEVVLDIKLFLLRSYISIELARKLKRRKTQYKLVFFVFSLTSIFCLPWVWPI